MPHRGRAATSSWRETLISNAARVRAVALVLLRDLLGGPMRVIALIDEPAAVRRILEHLSAFLMQCPWVTDLASAGSQCRQDSTGVETL